ncbi:MAG: gliding motility protein GldC [Bacteroidota bacterium]
MKKSEIKFVVELDDTNVPERILWEADDKQSNGLSETQSISLSLWDTGHKNTLRIDLWTKSMPVDEMKRFAIDCIGGLSQTILNSTGDEFMSKEMNALCDKLVKHVQEESKKQ